MQWKQIERQTFQVGDGITQSEESKFRWLQCPRRPPCASYCPFRRWALTFWSPKPLNRLRPDTRAILFTFAGLAIGRIDSLVPEPEQFETVAKLSERELSILHLISYGQSNAEAAHLKIGPETVKHHVKRAMRKLKARNRAEAVASAIRQGLMSQKTARGASLVNRSKIGSPQAALGQNRLSSE